VPKSLPEERCTASRLHQAASRAVAVASSLYKEAVVANSEADGPGGRAKANA